MEPESPPEPEPAAADPPPPEAEAEPAAPVAPAPDTQPLRDAFARGDHSEAGRIAREMVASGDPARVSEGEKALDRLRPDPKITAVFVATALLMLGLALHWLGHRH